MTTDMSHNIGLYSNYVFTDEICAQEARGLLYKVCSLKAMSCTWDTGSIKILIYNATDLW